MTFKSVVKDFMPPIITRQIQKFLTKRAIAVRKFDPDFFVVSPHGAGLQSFLYYLSLLDIPSTWETYQLPVKYNSNNIPRKRGITLDRVGQFDTLHFKKKERPVFWLIRDPILLLTACINQHIGEHINLFSNYPYNDFCAHLPTFLAYLLNDKPQFYCMYTSQLQSVPHSENVYPIDTTDLMPDKCCETIKKILSVFDLNFDLNYANGSQFTISYNSFENRFYKYVIPIIIKNTNFLFCPSQLYNYHFQHWRKTYSVCKLILADEDYTVFSYDKNAANFLFDKLEEEFIKYNIELYNKYRTFIFSLYQKTKIHPSDLVDFLMSNSGSVYYSRLMSLLDNEMTSVKAIAADKVECWCYYKKLFRS